MRVLADLSDAELLDAAGEGAELENGKPPFGSREWFTWTDLHHPAKSDGYFTARPQREPGEAGPGEWEALPTYLDYVDAHRVTPKPGWSS